MNATHFSTLDSLVSGATARVVGINSGVGGLPAGLAERLLELGFEDGAEVETLHRAPLGGDPLAVRVDGAVIALRRAVARKVLVSTPLALLP